MKNVEDLYPLTPMQSVMLLRATTSPRILVDRFTYELEGAVDVARLRGAWTQLVARHPALRTAFVWQGVKEPLQVVRQTVEAPIVLHDDAASLEASAAAGFDLGAAPLVRLDLAPGEAGTTLVWTSHHLVLDRWCIGVLLEELGRLYAGARPSELGLAPRFRDYVAWVQSRGEHDVARHWSSYLRGVDGAARTFPRSPGDGGLALAAWSGRRFEDLRKFARRERVTPGVVIQAAWALALAEARRNGDVVFGLTVSGRPPEVPGVERLVGSLIGNVPVRVRIDPEDTPSSIVRRLQREALARGPFEHAAAPDVHGWSGIAPGEELFDSLLVWLAPVDRDALVAASGGELRWSWEEAGVETPWPLTLAVREGEGALELSLREHSGTQLDGGGAASLLERLGQLVDGVIANPNLAAAELVRFEAPAELPPEESPSAPRSAVTAEGGAGREPDDVEMMERMLLAECAELLGGRAPSPSDSFFDIGGNSLRAVVLHGRLQAITGRSIEILTLFQATTLREMAVLLAQGEWPLGKEIVRFVRRPRGARPPLYCLSSPEVNSIGYVNLSRHLAQDQPVAVVQAPPPTDSVFRMAVSDLSDVAEQYADAILSVHPGGPVRLLGMCDGALIGLELARALEGDGIEVDFLAALDTFALGTLSWRYRLRRVGSRLRYYRERLNAVGPRELREVATRKLGGSVKNDASAPAAAEPPAREPAGDPPSKQTSESPAELQARLARINGEWQTLDTPAGLPERAPWQGRVTLFRIAKQPYWRIRDEALGWRRHARAVDVVRLRPSNESGPDPEARPRNDIHLGILREPDVRETAAQVTEALTRADAARAGSAERVRA